MSYFKSTNSRWIILQNLHIPVEDELMAIVQDAFYIPDNIAKCLETGLYQRYGSVIRYAVGPNRGRIVQHLKSINLMDTKQEDGLIAKIVQFLNRHKGGACIAATGLAIMLIKLYRIVWNNRKLKVLTEFRDSLKIYINAIRRGCVNIDEINALMKTLENLKYNKNYKNICVQLSIEELDAFANYIYKYTIVLAHRNSFELPDEKFHPNDDAIINLQTCLKTQKRIFEAAA